VEFGNLGGNDRPILEKDLNIRDLARSVIELNKPAAFAKDLVIHFKVDTSVPAHVLSDEFRISRILVNLVGNAIKFTNEGEVVLSLKATVDEKARRGLFIIEIKDTGIGISAHKVESIYEKFTRAVDSNTNKYPGTGLGLYVVKTFIDELNGDIEVQSYEKEGSCFKLSIPFKIRLEDLKQPGVAIDEHFSPPFSKEIVEEPKPKTGQSAQVKTPFTHEILLVEDDKTCLFAEKKLLTAFTNKIDSAESVAEALKKLAVKRYDLVISDLGLPDGSGCDIVAQIKAAPKSPNHKTLFVAMTAHNDEQKLRQAMDAGFSAAEVKPLTTEIAVELLNIYPVPGTEQPKNEGLAVIDLALGMQRISVQEEGPAIEALGILYKTLQEDIPALQEAEQDNDIQKAREILHKIRGGLYYSGTPRLEESFRVLHDEVKHTSDLRQIDLLFSLAYGEVKLFAEEYKELVES
jgi:CheY-like chemotaxis protein/two-component sensor histidine kinase